MEAAAQSSRKALHTIALTTAHSSLLILVSAAIVATYITIGVLFGVLVVLVIVIVVLILFLKNKSRRTNGWCRFCFSRRGSHHFYDRLSADGQGPTGGGEGTQQVT